jgi:hypothetical protein
VTSSLSRAGEIAWLPLSISAAAIAFPRAAPILLAASLFLVLALPALAPAALARPGLLPVAALLFLFVCGLAIFDQPGGALDLFEDGQILAAADTYSRGGRPYVDTYPIHGWGADGGLDAILFRAFGATVETFRFRRGVMTAAAVVALAAAAGALFEPIGWRALAFLAALCVCPFPSERQMLAFAALFLLLLAARSGRARDFAAAGAFAACELFYSFDLGLVLLTGGLAGAATRPLLTSGLRRVGSGPRDALVFASGAFGASLPFLAGLARSDALLPFLRISFVEIPGAIGDVWGIPAPAASGLLSRANWRSSLLAIAAEPAHYGSYLLIILSTAAAVALLRSARGVFAGADGPAWMSIAVGAAAMRGVLGRADAGHLAFYGVFAGLPAVWLLYRASRARRGRFALTTLVLAVLLLRFRPANTLSLEVAAVTGGAKARETHGRARGVSIPRSGRATLPVEQAADLAALRTYFDSMLGPKETFFDFGNEPGLYFLLGRRLPVRFTSVPCYESREQQDEVIARLESERPPLAVLASGTGRDAFDGVSNRERAPRVAAYLDATYVATAEVHGRKIARRRGGAIPPRIP